MEHSIAEIEKLFPNWYSPNHTLSYDDQMWIWENTSLPEEHNKKWNNTNGDVYAYGNVNGTCKFGVKLESFWCKPELFDKLETFDSKTPPKEIAMILNEIFSLWPPNRTDYWLSIAQSHTPRQIRWVMNATRKEFLRGAIMKTPAHYFSYRIIYRARRKSGIKSKDVLIKKTVQTKAF